MLTVIERALLLQDVELFSHITSEQISFFAAISEELWIRPGEIVYQENDAPDGLYVVISGSVRMKRGTEEIDRIGANGSFGVWALFDDEPRLATARTLEASHLLFVSREDFYDVLADHVEIVEGLFKHLVRRIRRLATMAES